MNNPATQIALQDLNVIDYKKAWDYQKYIFEKMLDAKMQQPASIPTQHLLFCEHPHVYTLGKSGDMQNLLLDEKEMKDKGISFYHIDRGGDITYHGLGQLTVYPLLDLEQLSISLRQYVFLLEEVIIQLLAHYGIKSDRLEGASGVWIEAERKICALGIKSSKYITMHGLAFNVNTDLNYFSYINPCGFADKGVTSLEKETGKKMDMTEVKSLFQSYFSQIFKAELIKDKDLVI